MTYGTKPFHTPFPHNPDTFSPGVGRAYTTGHAIQVAARFVDTLVDHYLRADSPGEINSSVVINNGQFRLAGVVSNPPAISYHEVMVDVLAQTGHAALGEGSCGHGYEVVDLLQGGPVDPELAGLFPYSVLFPPNARGLGIFGGYATDETETLMPLPRVLARRLAQQIETDHAAGLAACLCPGAHVQVHIAYRQGVAEQVQGVTLEVGYRPGATAEQCRLYITERLLPRGLAEWWHKDIVVEIGTRDCTTEPGTQLGYGRSGKDLLSENYDGAGWHAGNTIYGVYPTRLARCVPYACRWVARRIIREKLANRVEVYAAYRGDDQKPWAIRAEPFGTGDPAKIEAYIREHFSFDRQEIVDQLGLRKVSYADTARYGHFGHPGFPWEQD